MTLNLCLKSCLVIYRLLLPDLYIYTTNEFTTTYHKVISLIKERWKLALSISFEI